MIEESRIESQPNAALKRFDRVLPLHDRIVIGWVFAIKLSMFLLGASVVRIFDSKAVEGFRASLELWKRWDTLTFLDVASLGYNRGPRLVAYPLFPWLVRACTWITHDYYVAALLVSAIALIFAAVLFRRLVRLDYPRAVALRAVWFFLIFPTAYFLQIGYTESLFLAFALGSILAVRSDRWWVAGLLGGLAAMTRANGVALFPVLAVEAFLQWRPSRKWNWQWLWMFAVIAGFCIYLAINYFVAGNAFEFVEIRRQIFRTAPAWPWSGIRQLFGELHRLPSQAEIVGFQELFFVLLGLVCTVVSWFRLRASYAVWMSLNWLGFASLEFIQSAPRYTLELFPIAILFGLASRNRLLNVILTVWHSLILPCSQGCWPEVGGRFEKVDMTTEIESARSTLTGWWRRIVDALPKDDWLVIGWTLAVKAVLFVFGCAAYRVLEDKPLPSGHGWLAIWNRWDALHYQRIAEFGYSSTDTTKSWFYPFFPWTTRAFAWISRDYLVSGFLVSGLALAVTVVVLRRLVASDFSAPLARRTVWFFLIFPGAYFLHIGYTESLFMAFAVGCLLAARRECWPLAGSLGAIAWMTRANGMILIPALAAEAAHQFWITRKWNWRWLWIALIPAGFGVYLLVNWRMTGDPFWFLAARRRLFALWPVAPWEGIRELIGSTHRTKDGEIVGAQELVFAILGLVCAAISWFKMRPVYAMWISANWLLFCSVNFITSMPRYSLTMFPIFILFAMAARGRFLWGAITVWSIFYLAMFGSLFVRGWWAF